MSGRRSRWVQGAAVVVLAAASGVTIALLTGRPSASSGPGTANRPGVEARVPDRGQATVAAPGTAAAAATTAPRTGVAAPPASGAGGPGAIATQGAAAVATPRAAPEAASTVRTAVRRRGTRAFTPSTGGLKVTTSFAYHDVGPQQLGTIRVPQPSMLLWTTAGGAPFAVRAAAGPTTLKIRSGRRAGQQHLAAGTYARVQVATAGPWTIQILPDVAR